MVWQAAKPAIERYKSIFFKRSIIHNTAGSCKTTGNSYNYNQQYYCNNQKTKIRSCKILQIYILCSAKGKYKKKDKSYNRDRKKDFISKISPHTNRLIFKWNVAHTNFILIIVGSIYVVGLSTISVRIICSRIIIRIRLLLRFHRVTTSLAKLLSNVYFASTLFTNHFHFLLFRYKILLLHKTDYHIWQKQSMFLCFFPSSSTHSLRTYACSGFSSFSKLYGLFLIVWAYGLTSGETCSIYNRRRFFTQNYVFEAKNAIFFKKMLTRRAELFEDIS